MPTVQKAAIRSGLTLLLPVLSLVVGSVPARKAEGASPIFRESLVIRNQSIRLLAFNNASDVLVQLSNDAAPGEPTESPAVLRGLTVWRLTPVPDAGVQVASAVSLSQRRDDGHVYVAGTASMTDGIRRACVWDVAPDGTFAFTTARNIVLPADSAAPGEQGAGGAYAVNKSGILAGWGSSFLAAFAVRWQPPYDRAEVYDFSTESALVDIDDEGRMLANGVPFGQESEFARDSAAVIRSDSTLEVPRLDPAQAGLPNTAVMMRGEWVVGNGFLGGNGRGYAWKVGTGSALNLPSPSFQPSAEGTLAWSINASGSALGIINGGPGSEQLILWERADGSFVPHRFADLIPGSTILDPRVGHALINDAGQVAVQSRDRLLGEFQLRVYDPVRDGIVRLITESVFATEDGGSMEFKVHLTRAPGNDAAVSLAFRTADETATAPLNYSALASTLTWGPGEAGEKRIVVTLNDNLTYDEAKTFKLRLGAVTGGVLAGATEAIGSISDGSQQIVVRNQMFDLFGGGVVEVLEGSTQAIIQFVRVGGTDGSVTLDNVAATDSTARAGRDYTPPGAVSLSWARGEAGVRTFAIPLLKTEPLSESRLFTVSATVNLEGASSPGTIHATVAIVPAAKASAPVFDGITAVRVGESTTISVRAAQGIAVHLDRQSALGQAPSPAGQALSVGGFATFLIPIPPDAGQGYFRARLGP